MLAALTLVAAEGGSTDKVTNPVLPTVPHLIWSAIFFFSLLILMRTVLLPPLKKAMRQREEQIRADEEAAERATVEAEQVRRDYEATIAEARAEAARVVEDARSAAEAARTERLRAVDNEVAVERQEAMAGLDGMRQSAIDQLKGEVGGLAVSAASKVVGKSLDASNNQGVVDSYVNQAGGLS